jgi:hypothetical protein
MEEEYKQKRYGEKSFQYLPFFIGHTYLVRKFKNSKCVNFKSDTSYSVWFVSPCSNALVIERTMEFNLPAESVI